MKKKERKENVTELAYINDNSSRSRCRRRLRAPVAALNIERAAAKWQLTCLCLFAAVARATLKRHMQRTQPAVCRCVRQRERGRYTTEICRHHSLLVLVL